MIVKVCGVRSAAVAEAAVAAGADWIGVVLEPRSSRHVDTAAAREVAAAVRGRAVLVGVMVAPSAARCEEAVAEIGLDALQIHGDADAGLVAAAPVPVIPAFNVTSPGEVMVERWWPDCLVLMDAAPESADALPGGTGRRVDTVAVAALARHRRLILAGGLGPGTVAAAVEAVRPAGVDASSCLESAPGVKDVDLVVAYVRAARAAAARVAEDPR